MEFVCKIAGQAGQGANVTGRALGKMFTRSNLYVVGYPEYPSLVRGGHNVYQVRVSTERVYGPSLNCDAVVALNKDAIYYHHKTLRNGGAILYDTADNPEDFKVSDKIKLYGIPINELINKHNGIPQMRNILMLGSLVALIDYPMDIFNTIITEEFSRKGEEVVKKNIELAKAGYDHIKEELRSEKFDIKLKVESKERRILIAGNEAIAIGAIKGGMKFYSAYPMTPASSILHYLAAKEKDANIVVKHTEDEISAVNYAVGAAYAGVRAMTGTSGGGFALMTETLGMAAIAETPLVIVNAQRTGPSTGMPTWTEQADLKFILNASQGDFLRVVIAPGDVQECFEAGANSFNLAEKYQLPVLILSDKFLSESHFSWKKLEENGFTVDRGKIAKRLSKLKDEERYSRYKLTSDGVSPRTFPGMENGMHVATSYTHDETGFSTESFLKRTQMVDKRNKKLKNLLKEIPEPKFYGPKDADATLVCWGSQKLPALDAVSVLEKEGIKINVLHFVYLFPLDSKNIRKMFKGCKRTIMVENNSTAQFAGILREYTGLKPDFYFLRYDGRQFFEENLVEEIKKLKENNWKGKKKVVVTESEDFEFYSPWRFGL